MPRRWRTSSGDPRRTVPWSAPPTCSDPRGRRGDDAVDRREAGGLDFLVNNAGILRDRTVAEDESRGVAGGDRREPFRRLPLLQVWPGDPRDGGAIVNLGSLSAEAGFHGQANYAAAKAGVQAMTRVLSRECARRAIRVNAVAPGLIETAMAASIPEEVRTTMEKAIPWAGSGGPRRWPQAVLFLCSPLAGYMTGHTLAVNGGWRG